MINPQWLRTYSVLVETGHFTRTAERLHMTQSGVSQHVRKLELQIGLPLLKREGKRFTLTTAGERLLNEARPLLESLSKLESRVREDPPFEGLVKIMSPGSVGLKLYPHLLGLQELHPQLIIDYRFAPNVDVGNAVALSKVDVGLMTTKSSHPDVQSTEIAQEPLVLITPATCVTTDWESLIRLGFINHPDGSHHAKLLLEANYPEFQSSQQFATKGFSNQVGLILEPVSMGFGFTVLPKYAVDAFHTPGKIAVHPLTTPVSEKLYLCSRYNRSLPRRMDVVVTEIQRCLSTKPKTASS